MVQHNKTITTINLKELQLHLNKRVTKILSNIFSESNSDSIIDNQSQSPEKCSIDENKVSRKNSIFYNYTSKIIVAHPNINSLSEKFDSLLGQIIGNIETLMVSEIKLDDNILASQFIIDCFGISYTADQNANCARSVLLRTQKVTLKL